MYYGISDHKCCVVDLRSYVEVWYPPYCSSVKILCFRPGDVLIVLLFVRFLLLLILLASCPTLLSYLLPYMFNKVIYGHMVHCMSCQYVACCAIDVTEVSLFACSDPVDVSLHYVLVAEAKDRCFVDTVNITMLYNMESTSYLHCKLSSYCIVYNAMFYDIESTLCRHSETFFFFTSLTSSTLRCCTISNQHNVDIVNISSCLNP
jgi:hypothetical protein